MLVLQESKHEYSLILRRRRDEHDHSTGHPTDSPDDDENEEAEDSTYPHGEEGVTTASTVTRGILGTSQATAQQTSSASRAYYQTSTQAGQGYSEDRNGALVVALPLISMVLLILVLVVGIFLWKRFAKRWYQRSTAQGKGIASDVKDVPDAKGKNQGDVGFQLGTKLNDYSHPESNPSRRAADVNQPTSGTGRRYEEVDEISGNDASGQNDAAPANPRGRSASKDGYEEAIGIGPHYYTLESGTINNSGLHPTKQNDEYNKLDRGQNGALRETLAGQYDTAVKPSQQNGGYDKLARGKNPSGSSAGQYDVRLNPSKQDGEYNKLERGGPKEQGRTGSSAGQYDTTLNLSKQDGKYDQLGHNKRTIDTPPVHSGQYDRLRLKAHTTSYDAIEREGETVKSPLEDAVENYEKPSVEVSKPASSQYETPYVLPTSSPRES